jgi:hypothetical protein
MLTPGGEEVLVGLGGGGAGLDTVVDLGTALAVVDSGTALAEIGGICTTVLEVQRTCWRSC